MSHDPTLLPAPPSILVVDDIPGNLELLTRVLRHLGYEPRPFKDGALALAGARAAPPDLVLLDVNMPGIDGFEVCRALKRDPALRDIPVIFITVHAGTEEKVKAFAAGAVDYVTKPFQADEIGARLEAHLKIRSLQRRLASENERLERLVAERTRQLAEACARQAELGRLKNEFLRMISHELRTPAHGVLAVGDLLLEWLPATDEAALLRDGFGQSSARLRALIDDATMLAGLDDLVLQAGESLTLADLVARARTATARHLVFERPPAVDSAQVRGAPELLHKALTTLLDLAAAFSSGQSALTLQARDEGECIRLRLELDALKLSAESAADFFRVESSVRSRSDAERLGLAPVVAERIVGACGGAVTLSKGPGTQGDLVVLLGKARVVAASESDAWPTEAR